MHGRISLILALLFSLSILSGCEREGPAERAGESIDETTERAGERIEDATQR